MGQVNGRGRFSTLHRSETPGPIFMKLEIYNYLPDTTPHAQFQGPTSTLVVWANSQFDAWKFLYFFFVPSPRPQVAFLDTSQRSIRHYASFPPTAVHRLVTGGYTHKKTILEKKTFSLTCPYGPKTKLQNSVRPLAFAVRLPSPLPVSDWQRDISRC